MQNITAKEGVCFLGKTLELTNGFLTLAVTLDVGPRIIALYKKGEKNIMFEDHADAVNKDVSALYGAGKAWHIYGGHRLWLSPEDDATYYPDNTPVAYELTADGAVFRPRYWDGADVQMVLSVRFLERGTLEVTGEAAYGGNNARTCALWGLTVLRPGGVLTVPLEEKDTGYLANRNFVFWAYSDVKDARFSLENNLLRVASSANAKTPFKVGLYKEELAARYEIENTVFTKRLSSPPADYPDYGCSFETYTSNLIHEVEGLSPLKKLTKGEKVSLKEIWEIE